jgi:hypothetical protein
VNWQQVNVVFGMEGVAVVFLIDPSINKDFPMAQRRQSPHSGRRQDRSGKTASGGFMKTVFRGRDA